MHTPEALWAFSAAAALGICLFTLAHKLRISAIIVLLLGGILCGPQALALVDPHALGEGLGPIISLSVALILFEGGLTLDLKGYRGASGEIWRILSVGVLVTWIGTSVLLRMVFGFEWDFSILAASLVIVTGPTVIGPMLNRIRTQKKLHDILHWEGVLIDPIGVFIALMSFEYYISTDSSNQLILQDFLLRFVVGVALGIACGVLMDLCLRRGWVYEGHVNKFALAMAMLIFALSDLVIVESGLLSVTVAGLVLGARQTPQLHQIASYKDELKDFLIGLLFVLLAANLDLGSFRRFGWQLAVVVLGVMLLIRPLNVFASLFRSSLSVREKLFLSWIAPRGIVAASMASAFAIKLQGAGAKNADFLEAFTYSVIVGTVVIQGFTAGAVGKMLGVLRPMPTGWINRWGARVGAATSPDFFRSQGVDAVLLDTNARETQLAEREGLTALSEDAMQVIPEAHVSLYECGNLLALTANPDLNRMLCRRWSELLEGPHLLRWEKDGYETEAQRHLLSGQRVWEQFPLNRWMHPGSDLPPLQSRTAGDAVPPTAEHVLVTVRGASLLLRTPSQLEPDDSAWLVYDPERAREHIPLPLDPGNVIFSRQPDLQELYREMLQHFAERHPAIDPDRLLVELWKREEDYTSLVGNGIALPHAWSSHVNQPSLMVARSEEGVRCSLTDCSISYVFMLLSPVGNPEEHLANLSAIARLVGSESQREQLNQARTPSELYDQIVSGS